MTERRRRTPTIRPNHLTLLKENQKYGNLAQLKTTLNIDDALFRKATGIAFTSIVVGLALLQPATQQGMAAPEADSANSASNATWASVVPWTHAWDMQDAITYDDDGRAWTNAPAKRVDGVPDLGTSAQKMPLKRDGGSWGKLFGARPVPGPKFIAKSKRFNDRPAWLSDEVGPGGFGHIYSMLSPVANPSDKEQWFNAPKGYDTPYWGAVLCRPPNGAGKLNFGAWDAFHGSIGTTMTMAKGLDPKKPTWGMTTSLGRGDPWPSTDVEGSEQQTVLVVGCVNGNESFMEITWRDAGGQLQTKRTSFRITNYTAKEIFFGFVHSSYVSAAGFKTSAPSEADLKAVRQWSSRWLPPTGDLAVEPGER